MSRFLPYSPEQAYLLPPSVREVLRADHLCFFLHEMVEKLDLNEFEREYVAEGREAYAPQLMLKVWLYAYALGLTSTRKLEQRVREDLAFRFLAGGATPDHWTLNAFRKRHQRGLNNVFTQVVETAQRLGLARLGAVAIDSTRIKASASRNRLDIEQKLRARRAQIRRHIRAWQKQLTDEDPDANCGMQLGREQIAQLEKELASIPARLERLKKSGSQKLSRTDPDARFLRERSGAFVLGYTGEIAVSEDHFIVAQRVTQNATDNHALLPMLEATERQCGATPAQIVADSGYFSQQNLEAAEQRGLDLYLPDSNQAAEINRGRPIPEPCGDDHLRHASHRKMRAKLRSVAGAAVYRQRKQIVEPVFGVLKEQRGMRSFRCRGLSNVATEFTLAALAYNLTRLHKMKR
jgi:transposase